MLTKYKMRIEKIEKETEDSKSLKLVPVDFDEGLFNYMPGQFFTLEAEIMRPKTMVYDKDKKMMVGSGEIVKVMERKAFSTASSPTEDGYIEILVKSEKGVFAPYFLDQVQAGDTCVLTGPQGSFMHKIFENHEKLVACWSAGSGIPSTISLMKYILDKGLDIKVVVFDSNKTSQDIIYHERIKKLVQESENFSAVFTVTRHSEELKSHHNRIFYSNKRFWASGVNTLENYTDGNWRNYFNTVCGSSSFINGKTRDEIGRLVKLHKGVEDHLLEIGIPHNKIDKDQFYLQ